MADVLGCAYCNKILLLLHILYLIIFDKNIKMELLTIIFEVLSFMILTHNKIYIIHPLLL